MKRKLKKILCCFVLPAAGLLAAVRGATAAEPGSLTVHVDQAGIPLSPMFYGLMTEEINHSYDGGLYAELVQNRTFKDGAQGGGARGLREIPHWSLIATEGAKGTMALDTTDPVNNSGLTTSLRLDVTTVDQGQRVGVANDGFWGMPALANTSYSASFYARGSGNFAGPVTVDLETADGTTTFASAVVPHVTNAWQKYNLVLKTGQIVPSVNNRLVISAAGRGTLWVNLVSLFPPTFNGRPNGSRVDIMEQLAGLHPAFLRLPGGNYLEGDTIAERFNWKATIGPLEQRPGHACPWGYRSSDGLGLLEFLEWCEDLHVGPVLAVYGGYSLQQKRVPAGAALQPYVQDALDEIEYVTGDKSSRWGAERAKGGHPDPFKLTYVEIGNEDNFDNGHTYDARFAQFFDAIKAQYPALQLIASAPGLVHSRKPDVVDDHTYQSPRQMEQDAHRHDRISRTGPKIFMGEWASQDGNPTPTMNSALGDAAFLTGLERNADIVVMQCYAPLLVNVNRGGSQWGTNLIGYNALSSFNSPSYYAQKMFAENRGDRVLPVEIVPQATTAAAIKAHGAIGVGTWATDAEYKDISVTAGDKILFHSDFVHETEAWKTGNGNWGVKEGALRQSSLKTDCRDIAGDDSWTDYSYSLKARKLGGNEGFLILFHVDDQNNYVWWNVGGWGNTRTALEKSETGGKAEMGNSAPSHIDMNRWYDIRVDLKGDSIRCYLDGKLVTEATDSSVVPGPLFASANRVDASGDLILKVVNTDETAQQLEIHVAGATAVAGTGMCEVLTGELGDINTIEEPDKIIPRQVPLKDVGTQFLHAFPGHSVSMIRLKTR